MGVTHTIGVFARDLRQVPRIADRGFDKAAREAAQKGNRVTKASAKKSAGVHGKHYHKSIRPEKIGQANYVFGPISSMPQGGMSFEHGSKNQPEHLDLEKGADALESQLLADVRNTINQMLWP